MTSTLYRMCSLVTSPRAPPGVRGWGLGTRLPDVLNLVTLCCYKLHFIIQENVHECQCTNYMDEHVPKVMVSSLHLLAVSKQHVKED